MPFHWLGTTVFATNPCVVDRLAGYLAEIKVPVLSFVLRGDMDNSGRRCVCIRGTPLGVFSPGRISLTLIGYRACVSGLVSCSDWPCLDCAVDFSPGGAWIGYMRPGLEDGSLIVRLPGRVLYCWIFFILDILWYGLCFACWMSSVSPSDHRALDNGCERCVGGRG